MPNPDSSPEPVDPGPRPPHLTAGEWQAIHAALAGTAGLLLGRALLGRTGGLAAGVAAFAAGLLAKRVPGPGLSATGGSGPGRGGQRTSGEAASGDAGDGSEEKTALFSGAEDAEDAQEGEAQEAQEEAVKEVKEVKEVIPVGVAAPVVVDAAAYAEQPAFFYPCRRVKLNP